MSETNIPYGDPLAVKIQSAGLFAASMQRLSTINRLTGPMPKQTEVTKTMRNQSTNKMPIVRAMDLTKRAGDEITFDLVNPIGGKPIMGSKNAEGLGDSMSFSQDSLRINQSRKPISAGGVMTQQRTPHQLRALARDLAQNYMDRLLDQTSIVHMAGARGFANDIEWAVPLASDADFSQIMINPVKAPTRNRHFIADSSNKLTSVSAAAGVVAITSTDILDLAVVDSLRSKLDGMPLPPPGVHFPNDQAANDSPLRVLLVSSEQYSGLVQSTNFRTLQANAYSRAQLAGNSPLFLGEVGLWNGILIVKMPKPIRFFPGDPLVWCASKTSTTETTTDVVDPGLGANLAVDRAVLLGGQALAQAFGKTRQTGNPFFWSEKELDHGDKLEVLIGMINGCSKIQFLLDHGNQKEYTDFGIMAIDSVVSV